MMLHRHVQSANEFVSGRQQLPRKHGILEIPQSLGTRPQFGIKPWNLGEHAPMEGHVRADHPARPTWVKLVCRGQPSAPLFEWTHLQLMINVAGKYNPTGNRICAAVKYRSAHPLNPVGRHPDIIVSKKQHVAAGC